MTDKLETALKDQKQQTEQYNQKLAGILGIPLNGQKRVEVPRRNSYVYVRLRSNQSEVIQAYNNTVATSYNLPVLVERQGSRYVVVSVDTQRYDNNWNSQSPFLPRHGNVHSFDIESGGGADVVWVYPRQIMPALVIPSGSTGADDVIVCSNVLQTSSGTWMYVGNTGTASLLPYLPTSPSGAIMGLVCLDTITGNPLLIINSGTVFSNSITGSSQVYRYIPTNSNPATQIPLAAIRLITGTNQISWDNIYDVRQWVHSIPTGIGGVPANTYVPYTGATQNVNLGGRNFQTTGSTVLGETQISEGAVLRIGAKTGATPTKSYIGFGDSGANANARVYEHYDDSIGISVLGGTGTVLLVGFNDGYENIIAQLGDIEGWDHGIFINVCHSGTVVGRTGFPNQDFYIHPSGTAYSNGAALVKEAPTGGGIYGRQNNGWTEVVASSSYAPMYFFGFNMANNVSDSNNDIDLGTGSCRDALDSEDIDLASAITKRLDASWAVGTNQGGLFTGSKAAGTWYHFFVIKRTDTDVVDAGFDTSIAAANKPANYDKYRLIGSVKTDGSGNIIGFYNYKNRFTWKSPTRDITTTSATPATGTVNVPPGRKVLLFGTAAVVAGGSASYVFVYDPDQSYSNPSAYAVTAYANASQTGMSSFSCLTNTSSQIGYDLEVPGTFVWDTTSWEELRAT